MPFRLRPSLVGPALFACLALAASGCERWTKPAAEPPPQDDDASSRERADEPPARKERAPAVDAAPDAMRGRLVGTWVADIEGPVGEMKQTLTYRPNGTFHKANALAEDSIQREEGSWSVKQAQGATVTVEQSMNVRGRRATVTVRYEMPDKDTLKAKVLGTEATYQRQ